MNIIRTLSIGTIAALACRCALTQNNVGNFYTGEVKVEVVKSYASAQALPTATSVLINDFTVDPAYIALNAAEGDVGDRHSTVQSDAMRMVKGVAKQIEQSVAAQHPALAPAVTSVAALPPSVPSVLLAQSTR